MPYFICYTPWTEIFNASNSITEILMGGLIDEIKIDQKGEEKKS